jgi:hypothetical protein
MNGGHWENYIVVTDLPDGSRGSVWQSIAGRYIGESRTPTPVAAGDADGGWNTSNFPINHLKPYRFSVWMKRVSGTGSNYLGVGPNHVRNMGSDTTTPNSNPYFWSGALPAGKWYLVVGYVYPSNYGTGAQLGRGGVYDGVTGQKIATGNDFVWLNSTITSTIQRVYQYYASDQAQSQFAWPRVDEINGSEPSLDQLLAMGAVSARNPITTSNVTTYIADAAIGNAQIGGDIYSSNWSGWGGAGWLLDRGGNFYGNNIYARGDIQASSLKANTLMVNRANIVNAAVGTLQIAGNAVTIPVHAYTSASLTLNSIDVYVDIQSAYVDPEGGSVSVVATFQTTQGETHARVLDPSGSVLCSVNNTGGCISLSAKSNLAGTYKLQAARSIEVNEATAIVAQRSLLLIGSKR